MKRVLSPEKSLNLQKSQQQIKPRVLDKSAGSDRLGEEQKQFQANMKKKIILKL